MWIDGCAIVMYISLVISVVGIIWCIAHKDKDGITICLFLIVVAMFAGVLGAIQSLPLDQVTVEHYQSYQLVTDDQKAKSVRVGGHTYDNDSASINYVTSYGRQPKWRAEVVTKTLTPKVRAANEHSWNILRRAEVSDDADTKDVTINLVK